MGTSSLRVTDEANKDERKRRIESLFPVVAFRVWRSSTGGVPLWEMIFVGNTTVSFTLYPQSLSKTHLTIAPQHSPLVTRSITHATMADPSASVSPQLLHHLHALCVIKYPLHQSLQPELLVEMLLKTPTVVQQYPFAWSMIEPPPPGSLMLSWHPPAMGTSCASDGYVWADPENVHTVDVKGYVCLPPRSCCRLFVWVV